MLEVRGWLLDAARAVVPAPGVSIWGTWLGAPGIGWYDDQVVVITYGEQGPFAQDWLSSGPGIASVEGAGLRATVRPTEQVPLSSPGAYAHRWFDVAAEHVDEVVQLSEEAWPAFEGSYDAQVQGLFRADDGPSRLLLVTRYASVGEWERSRGVGQAQSGQLGGARRNFERRRALTGRQVVRIAPLIT